MKPVKIFLATASFLASLSTNAAVIGSVGDNFGPFLTLSGAGTLDSGGTLSGAVDGAIVGGSVLVADDSPFADDVAPGEEFLAAGAAFGLAVLTFAGAGVDYISFLWGSPDLHNTLTVNSTGSSQVFTATGLGFSSTNGDLNVNQAVRFTALAGAKITSLVFSSQGDSFEAGNFSITPMQQTVPEPGTLALLGFGLVGIAVARRRRQ